MKKLEIKDWFLRNMRYDLHAQGLEYFGHKIIGETEKAYKLAVTVITYDEYDAIENGIENGKPAGTEIMWCPKSCMTENAQADAMATWKAAVDRYYALLSFARANGLKVRNKMKAKTILAAIRAAGLEYNY